MVNWLAVIALIVGIGAGALIASQMTDEGRTFLILYMLLVAASAGVMLIGRGRGYLD